MSIGIQYPRKYVVAQRNKVMPSPAGGPATSPRGRPIAVSFQDADAGCASLRTAILQKKQF